MRRSIFILLASILTGFAQDAYWVGQLYTTGTLFNLSSPAPPFSPTNIPGIAISLEPDEMGYSVGADVSSLTDSVSGLVWGHANATQQPYYTNNAAVNNGKGWIQFDTVNDMLTNWGSALTYPSTVFILSRVERTSANRVQIVGASIYGLSLTYDSKAELSAGTALDSTANPYFRTNWILWELRMTNRLNCGIYTNGIFVVGGNIGTAVVLSNLCFNAVVSSNYFAGLQLSSFKQYKRILLDDETASVRNWYRTNSGVPIQ